MRGFCPPARRNDYKCGKPIFLAKVHNQLLNPEYLDDVKRVLERQRNARLVAAAGAAAIAADAEAAFNDDLLPDYDQLRQEVLATWAKLYPTLHHHSENLPVMTTTYQGGGTKDNLQCYSCDGNGHYAGTIDCPNPGQKGSCAPEWWDARQAGRKGKGKGKGGRGKGKRSQSKGKGKGQGVGERNGT